MSGLTRRRFLEDTLLATTAAALAGTATQAFAEEKQSSSPNEKLSVAVIGVRGRGGSHISAFSGRSDTEVTYICDADRDAGERRCDEIEKKTGRRPKFVEDMRKVFDDKSVDIVSTATPNHWHSLCSIWAMQAGKDVYTEKPVSHNVFEGRQMVEAARKYNRICQTGTQIRSTSGTQKAIQYIHDGNIGDVTIARGLCYKRRGSIGSKGKYDVPSSVNYDLWCGPAPMDPLTRPRLHYDWHWDWSTGNGDLGNQGIHQMDVARWALGVGDLGKSVLSFGGRIGYEDAGETANTQVSIHDYGDRLLVFEVRGLKTDNYKGAMVGNVIHGTKGYVALTSYNGGAAFDLDGNMLEKFGGGGDHFANFLTAVRSRKVEDLNADILEGHLSSALCHLANISMRSGQPVPAIAVREQLATTPYDSAMQDTLDRLAQHLQDNGLKLDETKFHYGKHLKLDGEKFVGSDTSEASAMLTREYRKPFVVPTEV